MSVVSAEVLKGYFENGKVPNEGHYVDLIDSSVGSGTSFLGMTDTKSSYVTGSVLFWNATLVDESPDLVWDNINKRLILSKVASVTYGMQLDVGENSSIYGHTEIVFSPTGASASFPASIVAITSYDDIQTYRGATLKLRSPSHTGWDCWASFGANPDNAIIDFGIGSGLTHDLIFRSTSSFTERMRLTNAGNLKLIPNSSAYGYIFGEADYDSTYGYTGILVKPDGVGASQYHEAMKLVLEPYNNTASFRSAAISFRDPGMSGFSQWGGLVGGPTGVFLDYANEASLTGDLYFRSGSGYSTKMILSNAGKLGVNVALASIGARLHVIDSVYPVILAERTTTDTTYIGGGLVTQYTTTGDMTDGFGASVGFRIKDSAGVANTIGALQVARHNGSDTTGVFKVVLTNAGTWVSALEIAANGFISILDGFTILTGTTTGTKFGLYATNKIGLWGATPIVQPAAVANATETIASVTAQLNLLLARVRSVGLIAT